MQPQSIVPAIGARGARAGWLPDYVGHRSTSPPRPNRPSVRCISRWHNDIQRQRAQAGTESEHAVADHGYHDQR